jgi:hypothetical protein
MTRRAAGIDWGEVPWSLWAYVAATCVSLVLLLTRVPYVAPAIFSVVIGLAWDYFLLRAVRWVWLGTLVLFAIILVVDLATSTGTWWGTALGLVQLFLLLLPPTRRHFEGRTG